MVLLLGMVALTNWTTCTIDSISSQSLVSIWCKLVDFLLSGGVTKVIPELQKKVCHSEAQALASLRPGLRAFAEGRSHELRLQVAL